MKAKLHFLGTGQAVPTAKRNHTSILLQYKDENILIDCGEGTQRQFRKAKLNPCKITRILISHWHGDHILGIPGLLQTLVLNNYNKTLLVYGPPGTKKFLSLILRMFIFTGKLKIEIKEIRIGRFIETKDFYIEALPLTHTTSCLAYSFSEKDKLKIDKEKMKKLDIPPSPLVQKLKEGKTIKFEGREIKSNDVTYKEKGKKISFIFDTGLTSNCFRISKNSDLLICESTYTQSEKQLAKQHKHLTSQDAALIAKKSGVKKLILTHISQRYDNKEKMVLDEAKKIFKNTEIAEDLMEIEV